MTFRVDNYLTVTDDASVEASEPKKLKKPPVRDTSPLENNVAAVAHAAMPQTNLDHLQMKTSNIGSKPPVASLAAINKSASTSSVDTDVKTGDVAPIKETSHEALEREMASMMDAYDAELKKEDPNPSTLYQMALNMLSYLMSHTRHNDQRQVLELVKKTEEHVKDVKGSYHNTGALIFGIASAVISLAGAFCAFSPAFGGALMLSASTTTELAKQATTISGLANVANFGEKIAENNKQGERTVLHNTVEQSKEIAQSRRSSRHDADGKLQAAMNTLHELLRSQHQAFNAAAGVSG